MGNRSRIQRKQKCLGTDYIKGLMTGKKKGTRPRGLRLPPRISNLHVVVGVELNVVASIWVVIVFYSTCIGVTGTGDPIGMNTGGTQQVLRTRLN